MTHERDERWAYIVLAVLVVAYIVYRGWASDWLSQVSIDIPRPRLGGFAKSISYIAAPLIAVLSEVFRRKRAKMVREEWEKRVREEGFLRDEEDVKMRFVEGGRGTIQVDVRLTRAALYLFDRAGRKEPMRFGVSRTPLTDYVLSDAKVLAGDSPERPVVRVTMSGPSAYVLQFTSTNAGGWAADIGRLLGRPVEREPSEQMDA